MDKVVDEIFSKYADFLCEEWAAEAEGWLQQENLKVKFKFKETENIEDIRYTVKKLFAERGLPCTCDGSELIFTDAGREDDYCDMWSIILGLLKSHWFLNAAISTVWEDESGTEDVLSQAWKCQD